MKGKIRNLGEKLNRGLHLRSLINFNTSAALRSNLARALLIFILLASIPIIITAVVGQSEEKGAILLPTEDEYGNKITYYPQARKIEYSDGTGYVEIGGENDYVQEDGGWKRVQDARSLKGSHYQPVYLEKDTFFDLEILDYNWTSVIFKPVIKDTKELNKDIPIKMDDIEKSTFKYTSLSDRINYETKISNFLAHNYSVGYSSTSIEFRSNSSESRDAWFIEGNSDRHDGADEYLKVGDASPWEVRAVIGYFFNSTMDPSWVITNFTLVLTNPYGTPPTSNAGDIMFYLLNNDTEAIWQDGGNDNPCVGREPTWNNFNCTTPWAGGAGAGGAGSRNTTASASIFIPNFQTNTTYPVNNQSMIDDANLMLSSKPNYAWILICGGSAPCGSNDFPQIFSSDDPNPDVRPLWQIEYTSNQAPNDPIGVLLNSTDTNQLNRTNEDLNMNLLCDDPDEADTLTVYVIVYKDGVPQFGLDSSCSDPEYLALHLDSANTSKNELWSFQVNVSDDDEAYSENVFSNNVTIENAPPVFSAIADFSLDENFGTFNQINLTINITDPDEGIFSYTFTNTTGIFDIVINNDTGILTLTSFTSQTGSNTLTITVYDGESAQDSDSFVVTVGAGSPVSGHPTMLSIQGKVTNSTGSLVDDANLGIKISNANSCSGNVFDHTYNNEIQDGLFSVLLGSTYELNMSYNDDYWLCAYVSGEQVGDPSNFRGGQGEIGSDDLEENITVSSLLTAGSSGTPKGITLYSPDGSPSCCSVDNSDVWSCTAGACT